MTAQAPTPYVATRDATDPMLDEPSKTLPPLLTHKKKHLKTKSQKVKTRSCHINTHEVHNNALSLSYTPFLAAHALLNECPCASPFLPS